MKDDLRAAVDSMRLCLTRSPMTFATVTVTELRLVLDALESDAAPLVAGMSGAMSDREIGTKLTRYGASDVCLYDHAKLGAFARELLQPKLPTIGEITAYLGGLDLAAHPSERVHIARAVLALLGKR